MPTLLQKKPFYFLTDRESKYTWLVTASKTSVYYPDSFERLSDKGVTRKKLSLVRQLLRWSIRHPNSMIASDYRTCVSRVLDIGGMLFLAIIGARVIGRFANKIDLPFLQSAMADRLVTLDTVKSFLANSTMLYVAYRSCYGILSEDYLYDLALEYRSQYDPQGHYISSNCSSQLMGFLC